MEGEISQVTEVQEVQEAGVEESELDEMWSFAESKQNPRWLWHAIDRTTGQVLADVFGSSKDEVFRALKKLLVPFDLKKYSTHAWGACA